MNRRPVKESIVSAAIAVGGIGVGSYLGTYAYKQLAPELLKVIRRGDLLTNMSSTIQRIANEHHSLKSEVYDINSKVALHKQQSQDALDAIRAEDKVVKEKIAALIKLLKYLENSIKDESSDLRETIKYASETTSKHLRADIADEVSRVEGKILDLRSEVKALVGAQHDVYTSKLKAYTETVSRTISDALAEPGFTD